VTVALGPYGLSFSLCSYDGSACEVESCIPAEWFAVNQWDQCCHLTRHRKNHSYLGSIYSLHSFKVVKYLVEL
jgi:hypothetical protein